jgi:hypothetical protein
MGRKKSKAVSRKPSASGNQSEPSGKKSRAAGNKPKDLWLTLAARTGLYAARRFIDREVQNELHLRIPFDVYFKDPAVGKRNPKLDIDADFRVPWEPGLADGPTSARFAVVDYDGETETVAPPARWDRSRNAFLAPNGHVLRAERNGEFEDASPQDKTKDAVSNKLEHTPQFHQISVWAVVQSTLDFFESGFGLGSPIFAAPGTS